MKRSAPSKAATPPLAILRGSADGDSFRVLGAVNGAEVPVVLDSGANRTIIRRDVFGAAALPERPEGLE
ncbi:MAG: hypothetical protein AAFP03_18115, partial [Cyanobacteria bacterium J06598_3]